MEFDTYIDYNKPIIKSINKHIKIGIYTTKDSNKEYFIDIINTKNNSSTSIYISTLYNMSSIIKDVVSSLNKLPKIKNKKVSKNVPHSTKNRKRGEKKKLLDKM